MGAWLDRLAAPLLDAATAAGLFLGVIALAMVACRQPARRCWLARAGVLGALAIGPLSALAAVPRIDLAGPLLAAGPPSWTVAPAPTDPAAVGLRAASPAFRRSLTAAYLAGATLGLAGLILGWWGARWVEARSSAPSEDSRALYDELADDLSPRRRPRLRVSARLRRPGLLGVLHPLIVVPPALDRPEARAELRLCLLHELAHARRRDPGFGQLAALAQALWFPWPQAWWIRAQMRLDQEYLTDRLAVAGFGTSGAYAASLVALADPGPAPSDSSSPAPAPTGELGSRIFRRVLMLVRCPFPVEPTPPFWWRLASSALVIPLSLVASGLTVSAVPPPRPAFPDHGTFRMVRLTLPATPADRLPPPKPFQLPLRSLTPRYQLTLQAWAEVPEALADTRILGLALAPGPVEAPAWHAVRIRREPGHLSLWLDDRLIHDQVDPPLTDPVPTFQPLPGRAAAFREVKLIW